MKNKKYTNDIWMHNAILMHRDLDKKIPIHVEIEVTKNCNHRCAFCFSNGGLKGTVNYNNKNMSFPYDRLITLIDELKDIGVKAISLTGVGDPLVYPHIFELLDYIASKDIEIGITTNLCFRLTDEQIKTLNRCSWIRTSINATDEKTYKLVHNPKDDQGLQTVINNIKRLDTIISVSYVVWKDNKDFIYDAVVLAKSLGVNSINFRPFLNYKRSGYDYDDKIKELLYKAKKLETNDFIVDIGRNRVHDMKEVAKDIPCKICHYQCFIDADGRVFPCCMMENNSSIAYGNIMKDSFINVWSMRKELNMKKCPPCRHTKDNIYLNLLEEERINNFI